MRVDQLATFCCVADERSYTRAAERLNVSQSAAYQQVRQLEHELGHKLFYVLGKEVLMTAAGRTVYGFATDVGQAHQAMLQDLEQLRDESRRVIRIGATSYFGILPIAADRVAAKYPGSVVEFRSMHPHETIEKIRAGEVDFGFFGPFFSMGELVSDPIIEQRIVIAAPTEHELARRWRVTAADLQRYPLIGYVEGSARMAIDAWCRERPALRLRYAALGDSSLAIKAMALSMNLPATVAEAAIRDDVAAGRMKVLAIADFEVSYTLAAIHRGRGQLSRVAQAYLDELIALGKRSTGPRALVEAR